MGLYQKIRNLQKKCMYLEKVIQKEMHSLVHCPEGQRQELRAAHGLTGSALLGRLPLAGSRAQWLGFLMEPTCQGCTQRAHPW